jgi:hypothetical protein
MCCWDVNKGCQFVLCKRSCIHLLGVGKALLLYVGQRTTSNLSLRGPCFNSWTSKVDSIWLVWFFFISMRHVGLALLKAKSIFTFHVEHASAKFDNSGNLHHSIIEHLEISKCWSILSWSFSFPRLLPNWLSLRYWWYFITYMNALMKLPTMATYRSLLQLPDY